MKSLKINVVNLLAWGELNSTNGGQNNLDPNLTERTIKKQD